MTLTSTHWGVYRTRTGDDGVPALTPFERDRNPSSIGLGMVEAAMGPARVRRPAIRKGWLKHGPASRDGRGAEPFVEVPWDEALDIVADTLRATIAKYGNGAIYGGSYGWSSAGRFHHAQSQIHRFLNTLGGYVAHRDSYSLGAGRVILPRILAPLGALNRDASAWAGLDGNCRLFVAFGGLPIKNAQVNSGGVGDHDAADWIARLARSGTKFVNISPLRGDLSAAAAEWLPLRPGSDTAVMLALAYEIVAAGKHDAAFLATHCAGAERYLAYLRGETDGVPKCAEWAAAISEIPAARIRTLALEMAATRTMIAASWSLQRAWNGEQPYWAAICLAAVLGQIGLQGGGIGFGYAAINGVGHRSTGFAGPTLPQGKNAIDDFIPVARIADMLLDPGGEYDYDGARRRYPDIKLVYWAGGNVFHHHQDINRLIAAWRRPETTIVHEQFWTAHARHCDIVLPATVPLERDDIGGANDDSYLIAMKRAMAPAGEARDDYAIFADLAARLGTADAFTEGRDAGAWLRHLYAECRAVHPYLPAFDEFWKTDFVELPPRSPQRTMFDAFRADPVGAKLATPSGKIELYSETIAGYGYADFPGHPHWRAPEEWLGAASTYPLHMLSNQPATRLHSQYDPGGVSRAAKISGREPISISPADAAARGIVAGDIVRVFNARGSFLAGARIDDGLRPGVVVIATGAWYDPLERGVIGTLDVHGNPNVATADRPASRLSQGCAAQTALVEVEKYEGAVPPVRAFDPPDFASRD